MFSPNVQCTDDIPEIDFCIGPMQTGFAHVFDDVSLPIVLRELDTISDFVQYLLAKTMLIERSRLGFSSGEEELLGLYLHPELKGDRRRFVLPHEKDGAVCVMEGFWADLLQDENYLIRKDSEVRSYRWDRLIEYFNADILSDRMFLGNEDGVAGHEERVRLLASSSRETRRLLVSALDDFMKNQKDDEVKFRAVVPTAQPAVGYLFLITPRPLDFPESTYRRMRGDLLFAYAGSYLQKNSSLTAVVGLATETHSPRGHSEDILALTRTTWTPQHDAMLQEAMDRVPVPVFSKVEEASFSVTVEGELKPAAHLPETPKSTTLRNRRKRKRRRSR